MTGFPNYDDEFMDLEDLYQELIELKCHVVEAIQRLDEPKAQKELEVIVDRINRILKVT